VNVAKILDRNIDEWIQAGRIAPDDVIRLGAVVGSGKSDRHVISAQKAVDEEMDPNPEDFYTIHEQIVANSQGFFAMGSDSYAVHDLGHASAIARRPEFMAGWRRLSRSYANGGFKNLRDDVENSYRPAKATETLSLLYWSRRLRARLFKDRYIFTTEWLVLMHPDSAPHQKLGLGFLDPQKELRAAIKESKAHVRGLGSSSDEKLNEEAKKLVEFFDRESLRWGGAANDAHNPVKFAYNHKRRTVDMASPAVMVENLRSLSKEPGARAAKLEFMKKLYTWILVGQAHPRPEDWLAWAFDPASQPQINEWVRGEGLMTPMVLTH